MKDTRVPLSVLIVTKNRPDLFNKCLNSLIRQSEKPSDVIVIDASDKKLSLRLTYDRALRIQHIHYPGSTIPQARLKAIQVARTRYILFLDDDCELSTDSIRMFRLLTEQYRDVDFIMGELTPDDNTNPYAAVQDYFYRIWMLENFRPLLSRQSFLNGKPLHFDTALIKKTALTDIQFDVAAPGIFQDDDIDVGEQLFKQGKLMMYEPAILTTYHPRSSFGPLLRRGYATGFSNEYNRVLKHILVDDVPFQVSKAERVRLFVEKMKLQQHLTDMVIFPVALCLFTLSYKIGRVYFYAWRSLKYSAQTQP